MPTQEKKKTQDLTKLGNIRKVSKPHRMIAQCPVPLPKRNFCQYQQKALEKEKLNFSDCALFHMKTRVSLKYFVSYCRLFSFQCPRPCFRSSRVFTGYSRSLFSLNYIAQKMNFVIKGFFSKCDQIRGFQRICHAYSRNS